MIKFFNGCLFLAAVTLSNEQEEISRLFATKDPEKVSKTSHTISSSNNIILNNTLGHIELSVYQQIDIEDYFAFFVVNGLLYLYFFLAKFFVDGLR